MSANLNSPATRRAFSCLFAGLACLSGLGLGAETNFRPPARDLSGGKADQAEGRVALQEFRRAGIAGGYWLGFELRVMPRKGEERSVRGQMFGMAGEIGPLTRLDIGGQEWLIRSGAQPATWSRERGKGAVRELGGGDSLQSLAGTDLTVFDLQMPFLYWDDFVFEGLAKIRGRPAYSFILYPPAGLAGAQPGLTGVRVALDTQFHALVQAELLGAKGELSKTITLLDLKKVGEQWLPKAIDYRNHVTRDKTRLNFTNAALNLVLPATAFTPAALGGPPPSLDGVRLESL